MLTVMWKEKATRFLNSSWVCFGLVFQVFFRDTEKEEVGTQSPSTTKGFSAGKYVYDANVILHTDSHAEVIRASELRYDPRAS